MSNKIIVAESADYGEEAQEMSKNPVLRGMVVDLIEALGFDTARTILVDRGEGLEDSEFFDSFHSFQMQARAVAHDNGVTGSYIGAVCRAMKLIIQEADGTDFREEGEKLAQNEKVKVILDFYSEAEFSRIGIIESPAGTPVFIANKANRATTLQVLLRFGRIVGAALGSEESADPMAVRWVIKSEVRRLAGTI